VAFRLVYSSACCTYGGTAVTLGIYGQQRVLLVCRREAKCRPRLKLGVRVRGGDNPTSAPMQLLWID
jgi:hypothetical protein